MSRLFVAVQLDEPVKAAVAEAAGALRRALADARLDLAARWVPRENLHLTLWFIGEVADEQSHAIEAALAPPLAMTAFPVRIASFGAFPSSGEPRVLWVGVASGVEDLRSLHALVGQRLLPLGYEPERRPYAAHLTIARAKSVARRKDISPIRRIIDTA